MTPVEKAIELYWKLVPLAKVDDAALDLCEQIENETQPQRGLGIWDDIQSWIDDAEQTLKNSENA